MDFICTEIQHICAVPIDLRVRKPYVYAYSPQQYWQRVMQLKTGQIVVTKTQNSSLTKSLRTIVESEYELSHAELYEIQERVEFEIGINETLDETKKIVARDPIFKKALYSQSGIRLFANSSVLEAVVSIILAQNTKPYKYHQAVAELHKKFGVSVPWNPDLYLFPRRHTLMDLREKEWESLNLGNKVAYIKSALENLQQIGIYSHYPDTQRGLVELTKIYGIGAFTARSLLIYSARNYHYAFLDRLIKEKLHELYNVRENISYAEFDQWSRQYYENIPGLAVHILVAGNYPKYLET